MTVLLEVFLIKLGLYLLQAGGTSAPWLDLASVSGYKFLAAVPVILMKTLFGAAAGYAAIAVAGANIGTFMVKTLRQYQENIEAPDRTIQVVQIRFSVARTSSCSSLVCRISNRLSRRGSV